ncbi:hypothetical protein J2X36_005049 [Methylobacterium sp. BE186]|uniref:hypothetical protein n=1 Tax=Methylobacterium sp. BE186 TaxID=2817715 RepID=UPI00285FB252|nr:hypothetical protein [Methylobacterium sp. BE186]MDR7040267.1 hypothetical protein [Methylobacterium sp. BE186]
MDLSGPRSVAPASVLMAAEPAIELKQQELEARISALEYALQVLINGLTDRDSLDRERVIRLLEAAAKGPDAAASNPGVPAARIELSERF